MSGDGDRASRPNSLVLEAPSPEREPLHFDVQLVGAPPEVEQLVNNIKQVAEEFLYHWKTFPIVLPPSRFTGPGNRPSDIIIAPPCEEIDAAALDAGTEPQPLSPKQLHSIRERGLHKDKVFKPKKLNAKQLESIREWGYVALSIYLYSSVLRVKLRVSLRREFEVPSRHFPGQTHVWRVASWLQRGRLRAREDFYRDVARAVALVVVVARDRLLRDKPFSVIAGAKSFLQGLHSLLDFAIGMPSLEARDLDKKIREERSRYLVAELICKPEQQQDIAALAAWVTRAMRRAACEKSDGRDLPRPAPPVPCLYTTPQRTQVLCGGPRGLGVTPRLACSTTPAAGGPAAVPARAAAARRGHAAGAAGPRGQGLVPALPGAPRRAPRQPEDAHEGHRGGPPWLISTCLISCGRAVSNVHECRRAEADVRRKLEAGLATAEARLRASHPILSRADAWRKEKLAAAAARLQDELRWAGLEQAAAGMAAARLAQHRYLALRDLAFLRERQPLLAGELRAAVAATRTFRWARRTWRPARWRVERHFRGRRERVPTVLSERATSIVTPRSDPSQPVFLLARDTTSCTSTRWPGWRLHNLAMRAFCWTWNVMFVLAVLIPWSSPISLRTLLCVKPFVPDYELSQVNGTLFPKRSSETQTMWSRLLNLWRFVSKERTRCDAEPDTGEWLGAGGAPAAAASSKARACRAAGRGRAAAGAARLDLRRAGRRRLAAAAAGAAAAGAGGGAGLGRAGAAGAALGAAAGPGRARHQRAALRHRLPRPRAPQQVGGRAGGRAVALRRVRRVAGGGRGAAGAAGRARRRAGAAGGGGGRGAARAAWEAACWRGVLVRGARVPQRDSAFCRRVRGPGLQAPPHYQATPAQALAAVCARAELDVLAERVADLERAIERPLRDYEQFVHACFGPFSVQIAKTGAYRQLEKECAALTATLHEAAGARRRDLALGLSDAARARVRLTAPDLRRALAAAAHELARMYGSGRSDDWWAARGLDRDDWHALAANTLVEVRSHSTTCYNAMCPADATARCGQVFDSEVVVALDAGEACVALERGEAERGWAARCGGAAPDVVGGGWREWGGGGRGAARAAPRARRVRLQPARGAAPAATAARRRGASVAQQVQPSYTISRENYNLSK
ncbi:hypothetical protein HF086_007839 [Spodoptera exigua]|uniref:Uncharacterized protein n=1 Tax=Spodoptera exigua TaxID=7107 RepID=A0A922M1I8_SPOEX|nr:hypothetical protein HF086_007839 [Spodoptera exigua]